MQLNQECVPRQNPVNSVTESMILILRHSRVYQTRGHLLTSRMKFVDFIPNMIDLQRSSAKCMKMQLFHGSMNNYLLKTQTVRNTCENVMNILHDCIHKTLLLYTCGKYNCNKLKSWVSMRGLTHNARLQHHYRWSLFICHVRCWYSIDTFPWN